MARVLVLGAGVIGTTVAIGLRLAGYVVDVVAKHRIGEPGAERDPSFASAFAAASVIPHSVASQHLAALLDNSHRMFDALVRYSAAGVRLQRHFEVHERPLLLPHYANVLRGLASHEQGSDTIPMVRKGASVSAISFNCFFCDMPIYGSWLAGLATALGISHDTRTVDAHWVTTTNADLVVNCLGSGMSHVYKDVEPGYYYRGVLLLCPVPTTARPSVSYNYTPAYDVYQGFSGQPADVYFYPRRDNWVLGGTRQPGTVDRDTGEFIPAEPFGCELLDVAGVSVPRALIELNRELIRQLTSVDIGGPYRALVGYRHVAGTPSDPRMLLEIRERPGLPVTIDCAGFGGAGVTLSWGAALRVLQFAQQVIGLDSKSWTADALASTLSDVIPTEPRDELP